MCEYVNSTQVRIEKLPVSCGVIGIHHLPNTGPQKTAFAIATHLYHKANPRPAAFGVFSDVAGQKTASRGEELADFIKKELSNCIELTESEKEVNPRTGNTIRLWSVRFLHEAFRAWFTEQVMHALNEAE